MAGNRCDSCNKFVGLESDEPQVDSLEISEDTGTVTAEVTISRNCAECGQEMKNLSYEAEEEVDEAWQKEHSSEDPAHGEWSVEEQSVEGTESGGGRWAKNMIGFTLTANVTCKCGSEVLVEISAEEPASSFEEV